MPKNNLKENNKKNNILENNVSATENNFRQPLSGRESSLLALLAQSMSLSSAHKKRILRKLNGVALKIARIIIGIEQHPEKYNKIVAEGFMEWAKSL